MNSRVSQIIDPSFRCSIININGIQPANTGPNRIYDYTNCPGHTYIKQGGNDHPLMYYICQKCTQSHRVAHICRQCRHVLCASCYDRSPNRTGAGAPAEQRYIDKKYQ